MDTRNPEIELALYRRMKEGSPEAFDQIFRRFYPALCAYARQWVSDADAENIVQDIMLWLWENRGVVQLRERLSTYLFSATRNRCYTLINRGLIREKVVNAIHRSVSDFENPDFYVVDDLVAHIEQALSELPPTYCQAFEMNRLSNKSYKEIAEELGISPKTVDYRIQQAVKSLRVRLKDYLPLLLVFLCQQDN